MSIHAIGFGTSLAFYRGQNGLSLENPEKSPKGFPGPLGPGAEKARRNVENEPQTPEKKLEEVSFFDTFSSFFDSGAGRGFSRGRPF